MHYYCPYCNVKLYGQSAVDGINIRPVAGDITICDNCANVSIFNPDGSIRKPTSTEIKELETDAIYKVQVEAARTAVLMQLTKHKFKPS